MTVMIYRQSEITISNIGIMYRLSWYHLSESFLVYQSLKLSLFHYFLPKISRCNFLQQTWYSKLWITITLDRIKIYLQPCNKRYNLFWITLCSFIYNDSLRIARRLIIHSHLKVQFYFSLALNRNSIDASRITFYLLRVLHNWCITVVIIYKKISKYLQDQRFPLDDVDPNNNLFTNSFSTIFSQGYISFSLDHIEKSY